MRSEVHIERVGQPITLDQWRGAVDAVDGVRLAPVGPASAINPVTGETHQFQPEPGDAEARCPHEGVWRLAFRLDAGRVVLLHAEMFDDADYERIVRRLADALNAEVAVSPLDDAPDESQSGELQRVARALIAHRDADDGIWFLLRQHLARHLMFIALYVAIPVLLWEMDYRVPAIAAGFFFAGAKIRDFRWMLTLHWEWPTTRQLLDWPKIERLADGETKEPQ